MSCTPSLVRAMAVLLLLGGAMSASADWREDYREGVQAVDQERWGEVEAKMSQAVAENPTASKKKTKIYGMRFEVYVPHFFLGLARYHLGDCEGALAAWEDSLDYGVVQKSSWANRMDRMRSDCLAKRPPPVSSTSSDPPTESAPVAPLGPDPQEIEDVVRRVRNELRAAEEIREEIRSLRNDETTARLWQQDRDLVSDHLDAAALLDQGQTVFAQGRENADLEALGEAESLAARARAALAQIPGRVEAARRAEIDRLDEERRRQEEAVRSAPAPQPADESDSALPEKPTVESQRVPPPAPRRDATLVAGVAAYLEGDPRRAVEILENRSFSSDRENAVADLVRAAAIWLLYREGGAADTALLDGATRAVVACRQADSSVVPDESFFAPGFIRFFEDVG